MTEVFNSYSQYIRDTFGERVQKISVDAGFTCPNRDGTKGKGGCTYCNNETFNPQYTSRKKSIREQIDEGICFFEPKYKTQKYLAYFQAFSNTYDKPERLRELYEEALDHPKVIGLVVSTRPDAINEPVVELLAELAKEYYVVVELGVESTLNSSLDRLNRCHSHEETIAAFQLLAGKGIHLGAHLIIGLPQETSQDFIRHAQELSRLPIEFIKFHQLQIVKGTVLARQYQAQPTAFRLFQVDEYIETIALILQHLRPDIIIERFSSESPKDLLIAPFWGGLKNFEISERIRKYLRDNGLKQGGLYEPTKEPL